MSDSAAEEETKRADSAAEEETKRAEVFAVIMAACFLWSEWSFLRYWARMSPERRCVTGSFLFLTFYGVFGYCFGIWRLASNLRAKPRLSIRSAAALAMASLAAVFALGNVLLLVSTLFGLFVFDGLYC